MEGKRNAANIITGIRILGSILLAFVPVFSIPFYVLYLICGLSDMADGMEFFPRRQRTPKI